MFQTIYIEKEVSEDPMTRSICERFSNRPMIPIQHFGEIFNRKNQNFRIQKQSPSLILAKKQGNLVLPTPAGYDIGKRDNFYFSHMFNCIYDCRYCFLQGMYNSANYVVFVNFQDFEKAIQDAMTDSCTFFSGYDCDSLALEPVTHFVESCLPLFVQNPQAELELRTKSIQIQFLLKQKPLQNVIVAYTLTPEPISRALEHKTPSIKRRLQAIQKLAQKGWPIGLRFDPMIYCDDFEPIYEKFFSEVFQTVTPGQIHSATLGPFRLPKNIYKKITSLYPDEKLFAHSLEENRGLVTYSPEKEKALFHFCREHILKYLPENKLYCCKEPS